ncbi:hypothetical protein LSTR_LSTR014672 [Laodelphax striatellus]|uniref:Uncharacterized protein n=1 Tax=Laodelphax striatellus TaxID=195883 RepID=A0A482X0W5_LAOST|nr:hypothetical protein LSTR_LSTR014672 [Laodelphax striatellus]
MSREMSTTFYGREANNFNEDSSGYSASSESDNEEAMARRQWHHNGVSSRQAGDGSANPVAVRGDGDGGNANMNIAFDYEITSDESDVNEQVTDSNYVCACKRLFKFPSMENPWAWLFDNNNVSTIAIVLIAIFVNIFMPANDFGVIMNVAASLVLFIILYAFAMLAVWIFVWLVNYFLLHEQHPHEDDEDYIPRPRRHTLERIIHMQ